ncbi:MAG: hypothetical protein FWE69_04975 [Clostridiales bacterium]|nr:hypothetical protein [Clostridiales bacterium]
MIIFLLIQLQIAAYATVYLVHCLRTRQTGAASACLLLLGLQIGSAIFTFLK